MEDPEAGQDAIAEERDWYAQPRRAVANAPSLGQGEPSVIAPAIVSSFTPRLVERGQRRTVGDLAKTRRGSCSTAIARIPKSLINARAR